MTITATTRIRRPLAFLAALVAAAVLGVAGSAPASAALPPAAAGNTIHGFVARHRAVRTIDHPRATTVPATPAGYAGAASTTPDTSRDPTLGFVVDRGRVERIDLPPDARGTRTILSGINNRGQLVGKYPDPDTPGFHGMLLDRRRRLTRFDYTGALATYANKISDRGQIVGSANRDFPRVGFPEAPGTFGYLLERGRFTKIAYPGAVQTQALGINRQGQVVGEYLDQNGVFHGFRWDRGRFRTFDGPDGTGASITDVNDRGDMVGVYVVPGDTDLGPTIRGFLLHKGKYTTFDAFGFPFSIPYDINNRGQIAGTAISDADLTEVHGFLLAGGADGPATHIDVPGAARTEVYGLDDRGRLVGMYQNPDAAPRGQRNRAFQTSLPDTWPLGLAETQETP